MFRFMDRFSFYLRRQWNMSHFTVSLFLLMPLSVLNYMDYEKVWAKTGYIAIVVFVAWLAVGKARDHNKPGNVEPMITTYIAWLVIGLDAFGMSSYVLKGELLEIGRFLLDMVLIMLWATPGYKVPHEPDNLNYAPGAA